MSEEKIVISGTGLYTPDQKISNEELVDAYNQYVDNFNQANSVEIESGSLEPLQRSSAEFIHKASGINSRYVMNQSGILNPDRMCPEIPERPDSEMSLQCEMAVAAAKQALTNANKKPQDIDAVIVGCSNMQRAYPAISIEVQQALGIEGFAFDMNVACSSATFGIQMAVDTIRNQNARAVLVISPEITTGHLNFTDRDSHFIFGDVATAVLVESASYCSVENCFEIIETKLFTQFSNNIRNNFGFLNRADETKSGNIDKLFRQNGRKVFKEVCPAVAKQISEQLNRNSVPVEQIKRLWLHQANINMNQLISRKVLGRDPEPEEAPIVLDEYANTSSAGSIIAFHLHRDDLVAGDTGVICSFGAGYSIGSVLVRCGQKAG
ncbi:MAG: beta-ketoacyl-ACP synthase III [Pseudomonadales bacterium]|nr:beta-ketoacyl-ACP synthase III [Pseudomonadales bacterium]